MLFSGVPGQLEIKNRLRRMADDERIPHALLFLGSEGVGHLTTAVTFAQYIMRSYF